MCYCILIFDRKNTTEERINRIKTMFLKMRITAIEHDKKAIEMVFQSAFIFNGFSNCKHATIEYSKAKELHTTIIRERDYDQHLKTQTITILL